MGLAGTILLDGSHSIAPIINNEYHGMSVYIEKCVVL